jgi:hypothetical protein
MVGDEGAWSATADEDPASAPTLPPGGTHTVVRDVEHGVVR